MGAAAAVITSKVSAGMAQWGRQAGAVVSEKAQRAGVAVAEETKRAGADITLCVAAREKDKGPAGAAETGRGSLGRGMPGSMPGSLMLCGPRGVHGSPAVERRNAAEEHRKRGLKAPRSQWNTRGRSGGIGAK